MTEHTDHTGEQDTATPEQVGGERVTLTECPEHGLVYPDNDQPYEPLLRFCPVYADDGTQCERGMALVTFQRIPTTGEGEGREDG